MAMTSTRPVPALAAVVGVSIVAVLSLGLAITELLSDYFYAAAYLAQSTWQSLVFALDGQLQQADDGATVGAVIGNPLPIWWTVIAVYLLVGCGGAGLAAWRSGTRWYDTVCRWAVSGGRWMLVLFPFSQGRLIGYLLGVTWLDLLLAATAEFIGAIVCGLVVREWWLLAQPLNPPVAVGELARNGEERRALRLLWGAFLTYTVIYTAMNWGLWSNMRIPHGDSAMYEEHLWNLTHGKGFRSFLDITPAADPPAHPTYRLFLGEHIQVIHLGLLPFHSLWPSQLMMEFAQTLGIASLVFPLYSIVKRHTGSSSQAAGLAALALLAFPIHYLDIAIDGKTFRPTAFGFAIVLAAIDAFERRAWKWLAVWVLLTLTIQEDFTLVLGPLGLWFAWEGWRQKEHRAARFGLALGVGSAVYLWTVMNVVLPWFRDGVPIHYARYFEKFGDTPVRVLWGMLTQPALVWESVGTTTSLIHALCLLVPLGFLPLASPSRLLVSAPLFGLLCMNELALSPPGPFHHFHAPIMPLLLWAAAAGLGNLSRCRLVAGDSFTPLPLVHRIGRRLTMSWASGSLAFCLGCSLWTGLVHDNSPLGLRFWDSGRPEYWRSRYLPDERVEQFAQIAALIPATAHVASTDYVHTRLTHCERSYDYSDYRRVVPEDCDYIVIDTRGPYSRIRYAEEVRELQQTPDQWELSPDTTRGYFIVLKRKR